MIARTARTAGTFAFVVALAALGLAVAPVAPRAHAQHAALVVEYRYIPPFTTTQKTIRVDATGRLSMLDGSGGPPAIATLSAADLARVRAAVRAARAAPAPRAPRGPRQTTANALVFPSGPRFSWNTGWTVSPQLTALCDLLVQLAPPGAMPAIS